MSQNLISLQIDPATLDQIQQTIQALNTQLDFLIDLSADERRGLTKMGDRSQVFVDRALEVAQSHPDILPRRFDVAEFGSDVTLHRQLSTLKNKLTPLIEKLDDTTVAVGSDAYTQALEVYGYAKAAGTGEGLDELRAAMGRRFKGQARKKATQPEPA